MNLKQFKKLVLNEELTNAPMYLEYKDDTFLIDKYIEKILKNKKKSPLYVDDLNILDIKIEDNYIYIYKTDKLESFLDIPNLIVIFKDKDKSIESKIESLNYYIKFPSLQEWQIKEYMKVQCQGLTEKEINFIYDNCKNIYKIDNVISIIKMFRENEQIERFNSLKSTLINNKQEIFNLIGSLIKRDINNIKIDYNINPMALINLLIYNFKNIINVQMSKSTAESLNMNIRQFNLIKSNCGIYKNKELISIFNFLVGLDKKIKDGFLENNNLLDYIICNIINGGVK